MCNAGGWACSCRWNERFYRAPAEMLLELGYSVLKAKDADSAMAVIESGVAIDVLFTDVIMPGKIRSTELARRAQQKLPHLAVLFTSGYTDNAMLHGDVLGHGADVLNKPYTREELARKLRQIMPEAD